MISSVTRMGRRGWSKTFTSVRQAIRAVILCSLFFTSAAAQNNVGIGTTTPDASALLDLTSTSKGLLVPRMTNTQMTNLISPATGLLIFNTTDNTFYYYTGSNWIPFLSSSTGWTTTGNAGLNIATNFLGTTTATPLAFRTSNTEWMRILTTGQVGIGVTAPTSKLQVGDGNFALTNTTNAAGELRFYEASGSGANYSAFKANAQGSDITYTLPATAPTTGQVLTAGATPTTLQWSTPSGGSGLWALGTGSSSLVGSGLGNTSGGNYAISAGQNNSAGGLNSVAIGGYQNSASNNYTVVSGGQENTASGLNSAVGGGYKNIASNQYSVVPGGQENEATGINSAVGGGYKNKATNQYSVVAGGESNHSSGINSTVAGGYQNTASNQYAVVAGGQTNTASAANTFIGGGGSNAASAAFGTIAGGWANQTSGTYSFVGGGQSNVVSNSYSSVVGGISNVVSGQHSAIGGGQSILVASNHSSIAGGLSNSITGLGNHSFIGGGQSNTVASSHAAIIGGYNNSLSSAANHSMVFGAGAVVTQPNSVVFYHSGSSGPTLVGIRNVAPTEALDVTGNIRFSGALMANNASGTAGQYLISGGPGNPPVWTSTPPGSTTVVRKTSDESVTNSAALQSDDHLTQALGANQIWEFDGYLDMYSADNTPDIQLAFDIPAGATINAASHAMWDHADHGDLQINHYDADDAAESTPLIAGAPNPMFVKGIVITGGTSGSITLRWAQNTSNGTSTTIRANSYIKFTRVQ